MNHIGLFEGFGGFSLAAKWMGWKTIAWCELNDFCQTILSYYFKEAKKHGDITKTDFTIYRGKCDILTGGFPCQPYSQAGRRKGKEDDRHLWPEMLRAIREIQPRWVVGENVRGLTNWNGGLVFEEVQADLEAEGYEVQPFMVPASAVNAPHQRERIWFVAYRNCSRLEEVRPEQQAARNKQYREFNSNSTNSQSQSSWEECKQRQEQRESGRCDSEVITNPNSELLQGRSNKNRPQKTKRHFSAQICGNNWQNFPTESPVCGGDDGLPSELDGITFPKWRNESIKGYGNAVVPQLVVEFFKAIEEYEKAHIINTD